MPSYSSMLAAALALASTADAHMKMAKPAPFGPASLNNSPLSDDGSDYPCKQRAGVYDPPTTKNSLAAGSPQQIELIGQAVHGGGSCQVALTKDAKPTKDSKWMVIHTVEGGCPAVAEGNQGGDDTATGNNIPYKIPADFPPGEYVLAWTWFNRIGNREMYMNCAPVTVTGGSKKRYVDEAMFNETQEFSSDEIFKRDNSYPDLFRANIGQVGNGCITKETMDPVFPNPGQSIKKIGTLKASAETMTGNCGSASAAGSDSGSPDASPAGSPSGSAPSGSAGDSGTPTVTGEGSDMGSGSSAGASSPSIVAIPPPGAPAPAKSSAAPAAMATGSAMDAPTPAATGAASPTGSSSSGSTGGSAAAPGSIPCPTPGQSVCSPDGMKIGTCDMNKMAVMMPVAPGTKCAGGMMQHAKRSAKFGRRYGRHYY
ncbi:MAG: hypothetical protein Q9221_003828 [Calogaya cf. arnoldii]